MRRFLLIICCFVLPGRLFAQQSFSEHFNSLKKLNIDNGIAVTIDEPEAFILTAPTKLIIFALPNGNTTAQTFGKNLGKNDDWHYDIQHIGAQTEFIRHADPMTNYVVIYLENNLKSWPAWRKKYEGSDEQISKIIADLLERYKNWNPKITLSCHSGGGSFIFGYLNSQVKIPDFIERIGFLDATYGYETEKHHEKLKNWLQGKKKSLQVIAYNDSVVIYNGKPLVSPTGGTWYRSQLMAKDLQSDFKLKKSDLADRLTWDEKKHHITFSLIKNPEAKIYHTVLVEKNGFISLIFNGTKFGNEGYQFWTDRAYQSYILN